jgi:hypothetical protein
MPDCSTDVVLGGRYALGDVLGTGASATVYEASERLPGDPAGGGGGSTYVRCPAALAF